MTRRTPEFSIILAGGKGTRMRSADRHKVCFEVDGRPAIVRALDVYKGCGIRQHIVVVGVLAEQVMQTVAREHAGVLYAYQAEQLGTGNAARVGLAALERLGRDADVLLVAGDRLIEPLALERLIDLYYAERCDLAFMVGRRGPRSTQGRVLFDGEGAPLAVIELRDIQQRTAIAALRARLEATPALAPEGLRSEARAILTAEMDAARAAVAFDWLWPALQAEGPAPSRAQWEAWLGADPDLERFRFSTPDGRTLAFSPETVREADAANVSVYLLKASALRYALDRLNTENAQREEYLSDIVNLLAQAREGGGYRVRALRVDDPHAVMGYN
ncbi:MAG: NTP transferase domain-containing protein, partial [Chloroflexi bacterium]|nr:NTP transferase domain-containing protein [Chloroflexota bacterium]